MAIVDLFSHRQRRLRGDDPDVFVYDQIPDPLRIQLVQILEAAIGDERSDESQEIYSRLHALLCREYGVFSLTKNREGWAGISGYLLQSPNAEHVIDIAELSLQAIDNRIRAERDAYCFPDTTTPDDAIAEVNHRFRQHGIGYEYIGGEIIRIDSKFLHQEVVKPALKLLSASTFAGANQEYLAAHEHFRHSRFKECLVECLKAFESTMKTICTERSWTYSPSATASALIGVCITNGLFPTFLQSQIDSLRVLLESGIPTTRNRMGGHGQGATVTTVPERLAAYALHLTATNILLLVEAHNELP
ncbi:MAG: hypothetical protein IAG10_25415 [Planctomycetaceae bacterium]|nr:hypothetical protein [Planctomycetaceae bacterium]